MSMNKAVDKAAFANLKKTRYKRPNDNGHTQPDETDIPRP